MGTLHLSIVHLHGAEQQQLNKAKLELHRQAKVCVHGYAASINTIVHLHSAELQQLNKAKLELHRQARVCVHGNAASIHSAFSWCRAAAAQQSKAGAPQTGKGVCIWVRCMD